jgi:PucR C-terminal helix-turn-helix domain
VQTSLSGGGDVNEEAITQVAHLLLEKLDDLATRAIDELLATEGAYSLVPADDLRNTIAQNLELILRTLARERVNADLDALARVIGRRRAQQGVPLESVLHSFRIDFRVLWSAVTSEVTKLSPETLQSLLAEAIRLWEFVDSMSIAVSTSYRAFESEVSQARENQRYSLLVTLLFGSGPAEPLVHKVAADFGFSPENVYVVVAAEPPGQPQSTSSQCIERPEWLLSGAGFRSAWCRESSGQVGIVELGRRSPTDVSDALRPAIHGRVGVSPPFRSLQSSRDQVWLALAALETVRRGTVGVANLERHSVRSVVAAAPELSLYLSRMLLERLAAVTTGQRDRVLDTVRAYIASEGTIADVAEQLCYHRNTVLNHLQQFEQITGKSLRTPRDLADIILALEAIDLLG